MPLGLNPVTTIFGIIYGVTKLVEVFMPELKAITGTIEAGAGAGGLISAVDAGKVRQNAVREQQTQVGIAPGSPTMP